MQTLGLGPIPARRWLFVGRGGTEGKEYCWYEVKGKTNATYPVLEPALTGTISGIRVREIESKKEINGKRVKKLKFELFIEADEQFAIRSGIETKFTRGIVLALLSIPDPERLKGLLTIAVEPAKSEKVVFGHVYFSTGQRVKYDWDADIDLAPFVTHLQTVLGNGGEPFEEGIEEEEQTETATAAPPAQYGLCSKLQIGEIKTLAAKAGFLTRDEPPVLDVKRIQKEVFRLYGKNTVSDLTVEEAVNFAQTLLMM